MTNFNIKSILSYQDSPYNRMLNEWNRNKLPVYLFGCGFFAVYCFEVLKTKGISIEGILIDEKYWKEGMVFNGYPVIKYNDSFDKACNVLICVLSDTSNTAVVQKNYSVSPIYSKLKKRGLNVWSNNIIHITDPIGDKTTQEFLLENESSYSQTWSMLSDDLSRQTFLEVLKTKVHNVSLEHVSENDMYLCMMDKFNMETILDVGAFTGDTVESFSRFAYSRHYPIKRIISFEPDIDNFLNLQRTIKVLSLPFPVECICKGCSDTKAALPFSLDRTSSSLNTLLSSNMGNVQTIEVDKIDNMLSRHMPITFIKMDIEGEELKALRGAEETIKKWKPTLAISAYHRREDLITLPQYIKSIVPEYQLYLRQHRAWGTETVLYAKMKEKNR